MSYSNKPVEERNWMLPYGVAWATLETVVVILRLYSRTPGQLGLDDFFIVLAWLLQIANTALTIILTTKYGINRHVWDVPVSLWSGAFKWTFWGAIISLVSVTCIKISVLLFYRRLVKGVFSTRLTWLLRGAILFLMLYTVAFFVFQFAQCKPVDAIWAALDATYSKPHTCWSPYVILVGSVVISSVSVVTDFITVTLPAVLLLTRTKIHFTQHQRVALIIIFGVGYLTVVAGIVRTIYLYQAVGTMQWDKTWVAFNAFAAGLAESGLAFTCACLPSLNRLFGRYFRGDSVDNSGYSSQQNSKTSAGGAQKGALSEKMSSGARSAQQNSNVDSEADGEAMTTPGTSDLRFYGKSFYVDQMTEEDLGTESAFLSESDVQLADGIQLTNPIDAGSTIRRGHSLRDNSSPERGWPLP